MENKNMYVVINDSNQIMLNTIFKDLNAAEKAAYELYVRECIRTNTWSDMCFMVRELVAP